MSYIESSLKKGEKIEKIFIADWLRQSLRMILICSLWAIFLVFLSAILQGVTHIVFITLPNFLIILTVVMLTTYYYLNTIERGVTSERVILKKGIFGVRTKEIRLDAIEAIEINLGIIGRITGGGKVKILGTGGNKMVFKGIAKASKVKKDIETLL